jgi:UDP-N-acetylmuramoyl-L-alanyl-D-glutamate--2,6-diaminopimelate ligase
MSREPATLGGLARAAGGRVVGDPETPIDDVVHDSRSARPGALFVAVRGFTVDGHRFVPDALAAGAAVCVEEEPPAGPALVVGDTRAVLGVLAAEVHGRPSEQMAVVGVTGTNGKTTVTHMIESIALTAGLTAGLVGTVGARIAGIPIPLERTTPEASDFQRLLAGMAAAGVHIAAVEVSSHALALGRVTGTRFRVAAFTNLSQDHLDFHGTMQDYEAVKASLFVPGFADRAVVWVDDPAGARLASGTSLPVTRAGLGPDAEVGAEDLDLRADGSSFTLRVAGGTAPVHLSIGGDFNVANAVLAAGCAAVLGIDVDTIAAGLRRVAIVPGRFEAVDVGGDVAVIVDYAHTPGGIGAVVENARRLAGGGRVIVVVGAGGERDRAKRPHMGRAAARADLAVLTSDNPRSEDPEAILDEVAAGAAAGPGRVVREADRRRAIRIALDEARPGDIVLVLGKGHEQGQEFADRTIPFDDRAVVREEAADR